MKKRFYTFLVALVAIASGAQAQVAINATNFPDENFRNWLLDANNINGYGADGQLTATEIADIKELNIKNQDIANLKGLEYFTSMTDLYLDSNPLTSVDVSMFPQLEILAIGFLNLTSIGLSNNTKLKQMRFTGNQLTSLDFTKYPDLEVLLIGMNPMASVDVTQNPKLKRLSIYNVPVSSLDLTKNTALETLELGENNFMSLDLTKNTNLTDLTFSSSELTSIDLSKQTALEILKINVHSKLPTLDLRQCTALKEIYCEESQVETLNASGLPLLHANFYGSTIGTLDLSNCKNLVWLALHDGCNVTNYNASGCTAAEEISFYNSTLGTVNLSGCTATDWVHFDDNSRVTSLDISDCTKLESLYFYENKGLENLNVSNCTSLKQLYCSHNPLKSYNFSGCTALEELSLVDDQLTYLDISGLPALRDLAIFSNNIHMGAMQDIIENLPAKSSSAEQGWFFVIDTKDPNEGNVITKDQVAAARAKWWLTWDQNGDSAQQYAGVDTGIESVHNAQSTLHHFYTLDGRKVVNPTKGVYIVNGHKVVIK